MAGVFTFSISYIMLHLFSASLLVLFYTFALLPFAVLVHALVENQIQTKQEQKHCSLEPLGFKNSTWYLKAFMSEKINHLMSM